MLIWTFERNNMNMRKYFILFCLLLSSCTMFSRGTGQVIFHWQKQNTGVEKFSRDHADCLLIAKEFTLMPDFRTWFYSEETKLNTRADWRSDKGIWATYIPYAGAQPLIVNSRYDDSDIDPADYNKCMKSKGYWHRSYDIPEITNINLYKSRWPLFLRQLFGTTEYQ